MPHPTEVQEAAEVGLDLDWARRDKEMGVISEKYQEVRELDHGFEYRYPTGPGWTEKIGAVRDHLNSHFPFFQSELVQPDDGTLWLRITGPEGAKEILQRGLNDDTDVKKDGTEAATFREKVFGLGLRYATNHLRLLPDFLIIGAAKAGTTSLYAYLAEHPSIATAFRKELYFFDMHWGRGPAYYRTHFPTTLEKRKFERTSGQPFRTGEATPCYLFHPHVPRRVLDLVPRAKLIVLLRNPVQRAYSFYCMNARRGLETLGFEAALDREEERLSGELEHMLEDESYFSLKRHHCSYLARGRYAEQLLNWFRYFPREQFLILTMDELKRDRDGTLARAQEFLGLPVQTLPDTGRRNFIPYPELEQATRARLVEYFAPHNEQLYELLGERYDWDR